MQKTCSNCSSPFEISAEDRKIYEKVSPTIGKEKQLVNPPTFCPQCRLIRRISYRNDQHYYHNTCQLCKKALISIYSPDKGIPVLCDACFWSDDWNPLSYGQEFNFSRPFFDQFFEMKAKVPRLAIFHTQSENSEFSVHSSRNRNCYMVSSLINNENLCYSDQTFDSRDSLDLLSCMQAELCYESVYSTECFGCSYVDHCSSLGDCYLCYDCRGSQNLIGCVGQRNKNNMILNEPASAEKCNDMKRTLCTDPAAREKFVKKYAALQAKHPKRAVWLIQTEDCTGNELFQCKNVQSGFDLKDIEDGKYLVTCVHSKDLYDSTKVIGEMVYESKAAVDLTYSCFTNLCYQADNVHYCDNCQGSSNCFGCMSLKKHKNCIFNKQYSQEEYEELVKKIIEHMRSAEEWGEFFPTEKSPFCYNETRGQEWFPMEKDEVLAKGWNWSEYEPPPPDVSKTIPVDRLPNDINDIPDDILNWAITCEKTGKPFRIIKQELDFYRKQGLPIPHRSPMQRRQDRTDSYNCRTLFERTCDKCGKDIQTPYAPVEPKTVYCEECYMSEVY